MRGNGNQEGAMLVHEQPNRWPAWTLDTRALPAGGLPTWHSPNQKKKNGALKPKLIRARAGKPRR